MCVTVLSITTVCSLPSAQQDAVFELVSMAFNVALWYTKFASRLAGKEKYDFLLTPLHQMKFFFFNKAIYVIFYCLVLLFNSITEAEAKDVHRSLKAAAGIFRTLKVRFM